MGNLSQIWKNLIVHPGNKTLGGSKKREYDRACRRYKSYELVIDLIKKNEPKLFEGKQGVCIPEERIDELLDKIEKSCPSRDIKLCHNFYVKGLAQGVKKENWDVKIPSIMVDIHRQTSPFTPESFVSLKALAQLKEKFNLSIEDPLFYQADSLYLSRVKEVNKFCFPNSTQLHAGQIIFSAILNGALLNNKWLETLSDGIKNNVVVDTGILWVELKTTDNSWEDEHFVYRRWFPDPLTSLLILKWKKIHGDFWPKRITETKKRKRNNKEFELLLEQYIQSLDVLKQPSVSQFLKTATTHLGLRVPQFLIHYAGNFDIGLSLAPNTWARLYTSSVLKKAEDKKIPPSKTSDIQKKTYSKFEDNLPSEFGDQLAILKIFYKVFETSGSLNAGEVNNKANNFIETNDGISPILLALLRWGKEMLTSERLLGKKVSASTMERYMTAIAKPLVLNALILNLIGTKIIDVDWIELYDAVLEAKISRIDRKFKVGRINDFHYFLVQRYHCSSVNIRYDGRVSSNVNVNIVTPKEYKSVQNFLYMDPNQNDRVKSIQRIIVTLGYRCGLRANETLTIKISELHDGQNINIDDSFKIARPELLIKYNIHGKLKNKPSIRRIPLTLLLDHELKELLEWKKLRINELRTNSKTKISDEPLFCLRSDAANAPKYHQIFPSILNALKEITRDQEVNFHHLRHSFTNFLLLRLLSDDISGILPTEWYYDKVTNDYLLWRKEHTPQKKSLKSLLLITEEPEPSRKLLYLVSLLSGHIDPNVTMNSYLHLLDWILVSFLRSIVQPLSLEAQANLLGLTPKKLNAYRHRKRLTGQNTTKELLHIEVVKAEKTFPNKQLTKMISLEMVKYKPPAKKKDVPPSPFYLHNIFAHIYAGKKRSLVADEYEIPKEKLYKWVHCAEKLAATKTARGTLRFFKKSISIRENHHDYSSLRIIPGHSPTLPIERKARDMALKIYEKLHKLYNEDKELTVQGLNLFVSESSFERMLVTTRTNKKRKLYVKFMKKLVTKNQIRVDLEPNPMKINTMLNEKESQEKQMKYWRKELGLPLQNITIRNKSRTQATAHPNGKITIWIASDGKSGKNKPINYIVRFSLFMGMVSLQHCGYRK